MKRPPPSLQLILFSHHLQNTTNFYLHVFNMSLIHSSPALVELKSQNTTLFVYSSNQLSTLTKGYSPILFFGVKDLIETDRKIKGYGLLGEFRRGLGLYRGMCGQMLCVRGEEVEQEQILGQNQMDEILSKIKW